MSFLEKILASRRRALASMHGVDPNAGPAPRDFRAALARPGLSLIAEFKRASPSKGPLHPDADPAVLAKAYEDGGAAALSVLTEPEWFGGSAADLEAARNATSLPVLWKDFVIDPAQVRLARATGADAVLLIVRILDDAALRALASDITALGMTPVVEVFDDADLERALEIAPDVIGINQRDLETFAEDPRAVERLAPKVPSGIVKASFSAIRSPADAKAMQDAGVDAILVGEALMRSDDPARTVRELLGAD